MLFINMRIRGFVYVKLLIYFFYCVLFKFMLIFLWKWLILFEVMNKENLLFLFGKKFVLLYFESFVCERLFFLLVVYIGVIDIWDKIGFF